MISIFEIDFDLSKCLFIFNTMMNQKLAILKIGCIILKQRYEVDEKIIISRKYLIPGLKRN